MIAEGNREREKRKQKKSVRERVGHMEVRELPPAWPVEVSPAMVGTETSNNGY